MQHPSSVWKGTIVARLFRDSDCLLIRQPGSKAVRTPSVSLLHGIQSKGLSSNGIPQLSRFFPSKRLNDRYSDANHASDTSEYTFTRAYLEITLYKENSPDVKPIELILDRSSSELATKTLDRMQISVSKKLRKKSKSAEGMHVFGRNDSVQSERTTTAHTASLWEMDAFGQKRTQIPSSDVAILLNSDLWKFATTTNVIIDLNMQDADMAHTLVTLAVESCPPTILSVRTFENFESFNFVGVPIVVTTDLLFCDECEVDWYINDCLTLSSSHSFVPEEAHIGAVVSMEVVPVSPYHDGTNCGYKFTFKHPVQPLVLNTVLNLRRSWTALSRQDQENALRILTYNILADQYAFSAEGRKPFYHYVSADVLSRKRRLPLILHELLSYQADVYCLQEVDEFVFETLLHPYLSHFGYSGHYSRKKREGVKEGCALFWRSDRLIVNEVANISICDLLDDLLINDFDDRDREWSDVHAIRLFMNSHRSLATFMRSNLGQIAQFVHLTDRKTSRSFWVTNTHLYFHPRASHIRLVQLYLIIRELSRRMNINNNLELPALVVCGDFNSSLDNAAGKLMVDHYVPTNFRDNKVHLHLFDSEHCDTSHDEHTDREDNKLLDDFPAISLPKSFPRFFSALEASPAEFTHYVQGFYAAIDHIFLTRDQLCCVSIAPMPSVEDVTRETAMPSSMLPSDHVSVVCDILWK